MNRKYYKEYRSHKLKVLRYDHLLAAEIKTASSNGSCSTGDKNYVADNRTHSSADTWTKDL